MQIANEIKLRKTGDGWEEALQKITGRNGKHLKRSETQSGNQGKGLTLIKKIIMMMIHQTTPIHDTQKKKCIQGLKSDIKLMTGHCIKWSSV